MKNKTKFAAHQTNLLKDSIFLYLSVYLFIFFRFLTGFFVAKILGPSLYGLRTIFGIITEYNSYTHMGTFNAMRREVPYYRGKNDQAFAAVIIENVFAINIIYSLAFFVIALFVSIYLYLYDYARIYSIFALFIGLYGFTQKFLEFYLAKLSVDKQTKLLAWVNLIQGTTYICFCLPLTYFYKLEGLLIGILVSSLLVNIFVYFKIGHLPAIRTNLQIIWKLLKTGFPIMLIGLTFIILQSVDRIFIASMISKEMLGFYAVGTIISGVIYAAISEIGRVVLGPRVMESFGKSNDVKSIKIFFSEPLIIAACISPIIIALVFLIIDLPIKYYLFEYTPSIAVVKILLLSSFFISISMIPVQIAITLNRQIKIVYIMIFTIILNAAFSYLFIVNGYGINGVAIGTGISYLTFNLASSFYVNQKLGLSIKAFINLMINVYAPFILSMIILISIETLLFNNVYGFKKDLIATMIKILLFCLLYSPIFFLKENHRIFKKYTKNFALAT